MKLNGKTAVISGSTSGMGKAIAKTFADQGASVVITGRNTKIGQQITDEFKEQGWKCIFIPADISRSEDVQHLIKRSTEEFGKIDILVPNAGILGIGSVTEVSLDTWNQTINTNLNGVFYLCRYGIPELQKAGGGTIVINASIAGFKAFPNHPAYCASKGAVIALCKNLAIDYAADGIRTNCICPGPVETPLLTNSAIAFPDPEKIIKDTENKTLLKRLGTPDDIAKSALFLACDDSSWITGTALTIDGGILS